MSDIKYLSVKGSTYQFHDESAHNTYASLLATYSYLGTYIGVITSIVNNLSDRIDQLDADITTKENDTSGKNYLTIERVGSTPVALKWPKTRTTSNHKSISYKRENDSSWTTISSNTVNTITLNASNPKVYFKGNNDSYNSITLSDGIASGYSSKGKFKVYGDIRSLINSSSFNNISLSSSTTNHFRSFFAGTNVTDASNLQLPSSIRSYCYANMFEGCTSLTSAPSLPATTLANNCYEAMFKDCTSLTSAPTSLPATTLVQECYRQMFMGCSSLLETPNLYATTLAYGCYDSMFYACISLQSVYPLYATTLESDCYSDMFNKCISLSIAPKIYATTLAYGCCARMFYNCHDLEFVNWIGKITNMNTSYFEDWLGGEVEDSGSSYYISRFNGVYLGCDTGTFVNVSDNNFTSDDSGTNGWNVYNSSNAPLIIDPLESQTIYIEKGDQTGTINTTYNINCDDEVSFTGTGNIYLNLNDTLMIYSITYSASVYNIGAGQGTENLGAWLVNNKKNADNITFKIRSNYRKFNPMGNISVIKYKYIDITPTRIDNIGYAPGLFAGAYVVDASKLIMKSGNLDSTKDKYCYHRMFYGCNYLKTAPTLPATTLVQECYRQMFYYCTQLKYIKMTATNISATNCLSYWVYYVPSGGTFVKNTNTTIPTGVSGIPSGWTVQTA